MSIFNDLLPKIKKIPNSFIKSFNDDLKVAFENLDKFEEEFLKGKGKLRDKTQKEKSHTTTLQSIHEDEDETTKSDAGSLRRDSSKSVTEILGKSSVESDPEQPRRASKKRNKNEVDDVFSPEQDKRLKRNASVKAQSIISKQVNVNLTQKLRREKSSEKVEKPQSTRSRRRKDDDKENTQPPIQIKEEKISLPPEPEVMTLDSLPLIIPVKQEVDRDDIAMPPPPAPLPKSRKAAAKEKVKEDESSEEEGPRRRTTRTRKQTDTAPQPAPRATRGSSRVNPPPESETEESVPDARPKRTRAKKKPNEPVNGDVDKDTSSVPSGVESSAEKPRPKRTRKIQKATYVDVDSEKEDPKPETQPEIQPETQVQPVISPKEERISEPEIKSPILPLKQKNKDKDKQELEKRQKEKEAEEAEIEKQIMNETHVIKDAPVVTEMDKTVILPNGHVPAASVTMNMNETVVLETRPIMDATVVLNNDPKAPDISEDNSLLTDDSDSPHTPPQKQPPIVQPTSAVKEKVQQFEELASRVTRTKTRAMAKKEEPVENQTPPDKIVKAVLSVDTLHKMNDMIFNGKPPHQQTSSSAVKPRAGAPVSVSSMKSVASASKLTALKAARDAEEKDREDARRKKEALLEAKRELQRKKREEKMAAAAAARDAAERERRAQHTAAATQRDRKQAQLDCGRQDRLRDIERKKLELARKVAETEERRRAEEIARRQRLATEQRRADEQRRRQLTEAENVRKEAALMEKEIEKRQKEYMEKQKMKQRIEEKMHTPLKCMGTTGVTGVEPVYMCDGFQYLNSDEDADPPERPPPDWSTAKARRVQLTIQSGVAAVHVDRLFSVRVHSPDLRQIFPDIDRARLKRTSSAVWRTPPAPARLPPFHQ